VRNLLRKSTKTITITAEPTGAMSASMPSLTDEDHRGLHVRSEEPTGNAFLPDLSDSSDSSSNEEAKKQPKKPPPTKQDSEARSNAPKPQNKEQQERVPGAAVEVVASHYNAIENTGLEARTKTRIFYMRNFNNWVKSMQIGEYLKRVRAKGVSNVRVLDLGCGKGGDLLKWMRGNVTHVACADVAAVSMEHCETR